MTAQAPWTPQPPQGTAAWTPPPRRGIVPLHPLSFGTVLGRSFTALRQNPRVMLGFALGWQLLALAIALGGTLTVWIAAFSRLDTVRYGSPEYNAIQAGSVAITIIVAVVLGLAAEALGVVIQAVVVAEVAHEVVAEKLRLGALWRKVRPVFWRLIGYSAILLAAISLGIGLAVVVVIALGAAAPVAAVLFGLFAALGAVVLVVWLGTKLALVPSAILLERATIRGGIARSWRLTRTRFWPIFGVIVIISLIFQVLSNIVSIPVSLIGTLVSTVIAPTGGGADPLLSSGFVWTLVASEAVTIVIVAIQTVVQSTATGLLYVDARMRHEGLDLDLLSYIEQRDAGVQNLPDPYTVGIGRATPTRYPAYAAPASTPYPGYAAPAGAAYANYPPPAPYGAQPAAYAPHGQPGAYGAPVQPGQYGAPVQPGAYPPQGRPAAYGTAPQYGAPPHYAAAPTAPAPAGSAPAAPAPTAPTPAAPAPAAPTPAAPPAAAAPEPAAPAPDSTTWTAPGEQPDESSA